MRTSVRAYRMKHAAAFASALVYAAGCGNSANDLSPAAGRTIANNTFTIELGETGKFDLRAGGSPVRKSMDVELFSGIPADVPANATISLKANDISIEDVDTEPERGSQDPSNGDGGDGCVGDSDCDGVADSIDNCPVNANPDQQDINANGIGDACDPMAKQAPNQQAISGTVSVTVHVSLFNADVFTSGFPCDQFELLVSQDGTVQIPNSDIQLNEAFADVVRGKFGLGLEFSSDVDVQGELARMFISFGPSENVNPPDDRVGSLAHCDASNCVVVGPPLVFESSIIAGELITNTCSVEVNVAMCRDNEAVVARRLSPGESFNWVFPLEPNEDMRIVRFNEPGNTDCVEFWNLATPNGMDDIELCTNSDFNVVKP